jgi:hypothetical protein
MVDAITERNFLEIVQNATISHNQQTRANNEQLLTGFIKSNPVQFSALCTNALISTQLPAATRFQIATLLKSALRPVDA